MLKRKGKCSEIKAVSISSNKVNELKQASKRSVVMHLQAFGSHLRHLKRIYPIYRKVLHLHPLSRRASSQSSLDLK